MSLGDPSFPHPGREEAHGAVVALAESMLASPSGFGLPPVNALAGNFALPGIEQARLLFLNVFVAQALDQLGELAAQNKEALAEKAADYARRMTEQGVDLAIAGLTDLKAALGL